MNGTSAQHNEPPSPVRLHYRRGRWRSGKKSHWGWPLVSRVWRTVVSCRLLWQTLGIVSSASAAAAALPGDSLSRLLHFQDRISISVSRRDVSGTKSVFSGPETVDRVVAIAPTSSEVAVKRWPLCWREWSLSFLYVLSLLTDKRHSSIDDESLYGRRFIVVVEKFSMNGNGGVLVTPWLGGLFGVECPNCDLNWPLTARVQITLPVPSL